MPIGDWIKGQGSRLGPLVSAQSGVAEIADPAEVRLLFSHIRRRRQNVACRKLLFYALCHRRYILALRSAGDVFETLATV
jgi:asparagine synthase (glutamine-hydrolysing)